MNELRIHTNHSIQKLNTLRLDVRASRFISIDSRTILETFVHRLSGEPVLVVGAGANLLFRSDYYEGMVVRLNLRSWRVIAEDDDYVHINLDAGVNWSQFVYESVRRGWGGIENMAMVPGTIGGAVVQHVGCYGQNLTDVTTSVEVLDLTTGEIKTLSNSECDFTYRSSVFQHRLRRAVIVLGATLRLAKKPQINVSYRSRYESITAELLQMGCKLPAHVSDVYRAVIRIRRRKLPSISRVGTAGSFFKNPIISRADFEALSVRCPGIQAYPAEQLLYNGVEDSQYRHVKVPAGWLIQESGLAGYRRGDCMVWPRQANNIVNIGSARPREMIAFVDEIRSHVAHTYGIHLENEVEVI